MGSLPWAEMPGKGFILFNKGTKVIAIDIKIVTAILNTAKYTRFLSATFHHITPVIDYKKESFPLLNLYKVLGYSFQNNIVNTIIILLSIENKKNAISFEK